MNFVHWLSHKFVLYSGTGTGLCCFILYLVPIIEMKLNCHNYQDVFAWNLNFVFITVILTFVFFVSDWSINKTTLKVTNLGIVGKWEPYLLQSCDIIIDAIFVCQKWGLGDNWLIAKGVDGGGALEW